MNIKDSNILILGGWGLVGSAICRKLIPHKPNKLIISSLKENEAKDAVKQLKKEFPDSSVSFEAKWGNIFAREDWKDISPGDMFGDSKKRKTVITDIFDELSEDIVKNSALYRLIDETKPDVVIDCINTATAIAYLDTYRQSNQVIYDIENNGLNEENTEKLIASSYIPQLIRHVQILNKGLNDVDSTMYVKIGTTGTGGMGMNIPYTHSEERPSRVLMSKTAVAGAHTMLMFLLARTPNGPIVKEIKPGATIAWKKIAYDNIKKSGKEISLVDMNPENAKKLNEFFDFDDHTDITDTNTNLKSVYIDTGENGIFSRGEFEAISSLGQMEIVTPEEIAEYTVFEIRGGNTGKEIMQGLDAFTLGPTYRGGLLRQEALKKISELEKENDVDSIAFELLGPPRLSKLLHEANILRKVCGSVKNALEMSSEEITEKANQLIKDDENLRAEILSIGLPVYMNNNSYLRGSTVKIPVRREESKVKVNEGDINQWCYDGWIDLRESNIKEWQKRFNKIENQLNDLTGEITSSQYLYNSDYWENLESILPGKLAGWIFEFEDHGWRFKR